jgi:hypothetical protein
MADPELRELPDFGIRIQQIVVVEHFIGDQRLVQLRNDFFRRILRPRTGRWNDDTAVLKLLSDKRQGGDRRGIQRRLKIAAQDCKIDVVLAEKPGRGFRQRAVCGDEFLFQYLTQPQRKRLACAFSLGAQESAPTFAVPCPLRAHAIVFEFMRTCQ